MSMKEFILTVGKYLARLVIEKYTGTLTFELNMKDGGIGNVHVFIDHDLKKDPDIDQVTLDKILK